MFQTKTGLVAPGLGLAELDGLTLALGLTEADGLIDDETLLETELDGLALWLAELETDGLTEADGLTDRLTELDGLALRLADDDGDIELDGLTDGLMMSTASARTMPPQSALEKVAEADDSVPSYQASMSRALGVA